MIELNEQETQALVNYLLQSKSDLPAQNVLGLINMIQQKVQAKAETNEPDDKPNRKRSK